MLALAPLSARLPVQDSLLEIHLVDQFIYFYNLVRGWKGGGEGGRGEEGVEGGRRGWKGGGGGGRGEEGWKGGGGGGAAVTMNTMKMFCKTR